MEHQIRRTVNYRRASLALLGLIAIILLGATLKLTATIVLPFIIAVLLTFVLEPLIRLLGKIRIPRWLAAIVIVVGIGLAVYVVGLILYNSIRTIGTLYPKYESRFTELYIMLASAFDLPYDEHLNLTENLWNQMDIRNKIQDFAFSFSETFLSFLADGVMVVLLIVFLLVEIGHFKNRIQFAFEDTFTTKSGVSDIIEKIIQQITRYLSIKFFTSLATGLIAGIALGIVGMEFPVVWGVIIFILNFIPTIGSISAGVAVSLFALLQFWPSPAPIIFVSALMVLLNMIIGNIIEPRIQGDRLGLSPFVILVSLMGWGWIWGFAGLILAVPMTVIVKIICEQVPGLEPISLLIGSYKATQKNGGIEE